MSHTYVCIYISSFCLNIQRRAHTQVYSPVKFHKQALELEAEYQHLTPQKSALSSLSGLTDILTSNRIDYFCLVCVRVCVCVRAHARFTYAVIQYFSSVTSFSCSACLGDSFILHVVVVDSFSLLCNVSLCVNHNLYIYSNVFGHLGSFPFGAIAISGLMNIPGNVLQ